MTLRDIALASLSRQKGKRSFVLIAMALGCATVISLFSFVDIQRRSIESQFDEYGANIIILPKSDTLGLSYGGINVSGVVANQQEIKLADLEKIWEIPNRDNIRAVSPKLLGAAVASRSAVQTQVLLVGVFFKEELRIKSWWEIDGGAPSALEEVVVGSEAARKLGTIVGDVIAVDGVDLTVSGVLKPTGSQDDNLVFADFSLVSSLMSKEGAVSLAEVSALCSDCPIDIITAQIAAVLPDADIKEIRQVMQQKMQAVDQFGRFAMTVTAVMVAIGAVLIFTSMMGSVSERKSEIGIFRAIGFKKIHIISIILTEAFVLSIIAGLAGAAGGFVITNVALPRLLEVGQVPLSINPALAVMAVSGVVLLGLAAAFYPALKASRIDPVTAINSL